MNDLVTILWKEVPEGETRYIKDTYVNLPVDIAFMYVDSGHAIGYDRDSKEEFNPFLTSDYPQRHILIDHGIYTIEQLEENIERVKDFNGIGEKSYQKYLELLVQDVVGEETVNEIVEAIEEEE